MSRLGFFLVLGPWSLVLFFSGLANRDLWSSHEARAAQNAQTMLDTGDWGLPRLFDGRVEMQKPPLYYWLVAAFAWLRGGTVDAWAVRMPAALAAVGCVLAVYCFAWRRGRPLAGLLAAVFLATMLHFTWLARVGRIDMPLTLAVSTTLTGFHLGGHARSAGRHAEARSWLLLAYVSAAVAFLLKGPIGVVLAGLVILASLRPFPLTVPAACRLARQLGLPWGVALGLCLTVPWFLLANQETQGEFFRVFFWYHNFQRGLGGANELEVHPWWFYGYRLGVDLFPWSLLLPIAAVWFLRHRRWTADSEARFGGVWLLAMTLFLSCMSFKRADYLLPAYPGAALFLGCTTERWLLTLCGLRLRLAQTAFAVGTLACVVGWTVYLNLFLPQGEPFREHHSFAEEVRRRVPPPSLVLLFRTEAHALVFHLGKPFDRIMEWENLDIWACQPTPIYVVMPPEVAAEWPQYLEAGRLHHVLSTDDLAGGPHEQPLVLLCTHPPEP